MADPAGSRAKWIWIVLLAVLAVLALVWLLDPSGEEDEAGLEDPIVSGNLAEPAAEPAEPLEAQPLDGEPIDTAPVGNVPLDNSVEGVETELALPPAAE